MPGRFLKQRLASRLEIHSHGYPPFEVSDPAGMRGEARHSLRHARTIVIALALGLTAVACASDGTTTTSAAPTTSTTAPPATTEPESEGSASSDLEMFSLFGAGTYTMVELGIPVTFTVDEDWSTQPTGQGFFVITEPESRGPGDHDIVYMRPSAVENAETGEPNLAADDLDSWLATVPDRASVSEPTPTTVGGLDAVTFEATVNDGPFIHLLITESGFSKEINPGFLYEVKWIDVPDGPPIVIVLGTPEDDPGWLDEAREVVATLEIG